MVARIFPVLLFLLAPVISRADAVDDLVRAHMETNRIPGVALAIVREGAVTKTACYGIANLELSVPVTLDTRFEIGSVTKQFTAAAVLLLERDGKLSIDDRIETHLQNCSSSWSNITIRHLLTHTSGIKSYTGLDGFALTRHQTQAELVAKLSPLPLEFSPGTAWKYSNSGYSLLGYIVENVSHQPYWKFLEERITGPLGMTNTTDRLPGRVLPHRADGYEQKDGRWINRDYDLTDVFSAGALVSTVPDLLKWNAALDSPTFFSAEIKKKLWTPGVLSSGKPLTYGLGWFIDQYEGYRLVGHGGSTSGFSASIQRFPEQHLAVIILTNTDEQIATRMAREIAVLTIKGIPPH